MSLFISLLLVTATLALGLVVYLARQRPMRGRLPLLSMLLAVAIWSGGYALELIATSLSAKVFWNQVQYLGIVAIAPSWFAFVLSYTGIRRKFSAPLVFLLAFVPLITLFFVWTTDLHAFMWSRVALDSYGIAPLLAFDFGLWFWVHATYAYLLLAAGVALILWELWRSTGMHRLYTIMLLLGIVPVWGANMLYLAQTGPHPNLDWTPLAFGITCAVYAWGLLRLRLLTLTPLARHTMVEERRDGVLVVDLDNRIIDLNPAVEQMAGLPRSALAGQPLSLLLGAHAQEILAYKTGAWLSCELALTDHHVYELQVSLLYGGDQQLAGKLVVLRDVTATKQREAQLRRQNEYLAALHQISLDLLQRRELGDLLQAVVDRAAEILAAPYCELMLVEGDELVVRACTASMSFVKGERVTRATAKLSWQAHDTKQPVILEDYAAWSGRRAIYAASELHAVADYPIILNETCVGVLALGRSEPGYLFVTDDVEKGIMFSQLAALVLDNAQLHAAIQDLNRSLELRVAASTLEVRRRASAMDATAEGMAILHDGHFVYVNPSYAALHGYSPGELVGKPSAPLYAETDPVRLIQGIQPQLEAQGRWMGVVAGRQKNGRSLAVELILAVAGEDLIVSERDVTQRVAAERALKQAEARYRNLFAQAPIMYLTTRSEAGKPVITDCNEQLLTTLGFTRAELVGRCLGSIYTPQSLAQLAASYPRVLAGEVLDEERELLASDGRMLATVVRATAEHNEAGEVTGSLSMYVDITARKQAEEQLRLLSEQLRSLAQRQADVREEERAWIAREIHDELGQMLTALKMDVVWVSKRIPPDSPQLAAKLAAMSGLVSTTIHSVQRISAELRPNMLDSLGLAAAIEWQLQEFQARTDLRCTLQLGIPDKLVLDPKLATALFRIYQEALTNVIRHAAATTVVVGLAYEDGRLRLSVCDDGIGIDPARLSDPHSIGLTGMRERLYPWQGELDIYAVPGQGTTVCAAVPYPLTVTETAV